MKTAGRNHCARGRWVAHPCTTQPPIAGERRDGQAHDGKGGEEKKQMCQFPEVDDEPSLVNTRCGAARGHLCHGHPTMGTLYHLFCLGPA